MRRQLARSAERIALVICTLTYSLLATSEEQFGGYRWFVDEIKANPQLAIQYALHEAKYTARGIGETVFHPRQPIPKCNGLFRSKVKPASVHKLLPGDVDVVGGMGDSLTAANGASAWTLIGCLTQYRGRSFSSGGDKSIESVVTLPNILKLFNPKVTGYSMGKGNVSSSGARFNVAFPGKTSQDMANQARVLIDRMRSDSSIQFEDDWKMVTLFVGGNDLCQSCYNLTAYSPESYVANVREGLDILAEGLPRTYVNLVEPSGITATRTLATDKICQLVDSSICGCAWQNESVTEALKERAINYQKGLQELITSGRYDNREDFVVVIQPFMRHTTTLTKIRSSEPDLTNYAPDCFHFSGKGQNGVAKLLWKNLLQPIGKKTTAWEAIKDIQCPEEGHYLPTRRNGA